MFYEGGSFNGFEPDLLPRRDSRAAEVGMEVRELQRKLERLMLLNQAMWELLRDRLKLTDAELESMVAQVDLRDGVQDGKMTPTAVRCPSCGRVNNMRHKKCIYCSTEFESPIFG